MSIGSIPNGLEFFVDLQPKEEDFRQAVLDGLSLPEKMIPSKFFYDELGSKLFEQICETDEYYITRTELSLLHVNQAEIASYVGSDVNIVEYGCGSSKKIEALLSILSNPTSYIAIDISKSHLISTATKIANNYRKIKVGAICADFFSPLEWPKEFFVEPEKRLGFFPGSTIGNLSHRQVDAFFGYVRRTLGIKARLLIGVDTKKTESVLYKAYNDEAGLTSKFNLNLLYRMKDELKAELDISEFSHSAEYNPELGRVEMRLISNSDQTITVDGVNFCFESGESIHTESSHKYSNDEFCELAKRSGFQKLKIWNDKAGLFAIYLFEII